MKLQTTIATALFGVFLSGSGIYFLVSPEAMLSRPEEVVIRESRLGSLFRTLGESFGVVPTAIVLIGLGLAFFAVAVYGAVSRSSS
jgi:hypothetical protein